MRAGFWKILLSMLLGAGIVRAEVPWGDSGISLRGFGTMGLSRSSSDDAEFMRDLSQPRGIKGGHWSARIDSVLGLQANWQATSQLEFVGQVVSRYRYDRSRNPEVMWAFLKWDPDARVSLRAGRIGADFMMLADSRLVGYSYLTVRPSPDFFGPLFFSHFDGLDGALTLPVGNGLLRGKGFAGETQEKTAGTPGIWNTSGSPVGGWILDYLIGPWQFRANTAYIRFSHDIKFAPLPELLRTAAAATGLASAADAAEALRTRGKTTRFYSVGVVYDEGPLQVQGMVNGIHHETGTFQNSGGGYLQAGYHLAAVTPYVGLSWWRSRFKPHATGLPDTPAFAALNQSFDYLMRASGADQKTYSLGMRWDLMTQVALKLQWDAIRGDRRSLFPFSRPEPDWNGRTQVISAVVDFVF